MYIVYAKAAGQVDRYLAFESTTIAQVIAEKLESQGIQVNIFDPSGDTIVQFPPDPYWRLLGLHV